MNPDRKFSLEEIGSNEEEISFAKRQMERPPTRTQKKKGGANLNTAQLEGIRTYLETLESLLKNIDRRLERLEHE